MCIRSSNGLSLPEVAQEIPAPALIDEARLPFLRLKLAVDTASAVPQNELRDKRPSDQLPAKTETVEGQGEITIARAEIAKPEGRRTQGGSAKTNLSHVHWSS